MESIERFVLEQLAAWEVPGCAVAVVHDGHVVLAAGWGQRDLETKLPVTSNTLFAIGSTTKAFTAATVGALVEDGLLEWERPLRDYVPEIRLNDPVVTDRLTVIDLLSHRSGLPRHEMVWLGHPGRSRAEVVRRLRFLPLSKDLRQEFQYCNLGYLVAGAQDPEVLRGPCGTYAMGPIEVMVALRSDRVLTVTTPGAPPFELQPAGRGLRFVVKGQPAVTAEFELDNTGAVARLVAQPLGIFLPKSRPSRHGNQDCLPAKP